MKRRPDPDWGAVLCFHLHDRASIVSDCSTAALRRFITAYPAMEEEWSVAGEPYTTNLRSLRYTVRRELASRAPRKPRPPKTKNYDL
jgi:hypothetical protein